MGVTSYLTYPCCFNAPSYCVPFIQHIWSSLSLSPISQIYNLSQSLHTRQ